jgi:hypothetical protein
MLCCAVLCCAVLCCAVLCCAVLCYAVLCCVVLCCVVLILCSKLCKSLSAWARVNKRYWLCTVKQDLAELVHWSLCMQWSTISSAHQISLGGLELQGQVASSAPSSSISVRSRRACTNYQKALQFGILLNQMSRISPTSSPYGSSPPLYESSSINLY